MVATESDGKAEKGKATEGRFSWCKTCFYIGQAAEQTTPEVKEVDKDDKAILKVTKAQNVSPKGQSFKFSEGGHFSRMANFLLDYMNVGSAQLLGKM